MRDVEVEDIATIQERGGLGIDQTARAQQISRNGWEFVCRRLAWFPIAVMRLVSGELAVIIKGLSTSATPIGWFVLAALEEVYGYKKSVVGIRVH